MALFQRFAKAVSDAGMLVSVAVIVGMTLLVLTEVVLRTFFASSTYIMDELVGYGIGAASFMALGHSLSRGGLIRMNLVISRLDPEGLARRLVELMCIGFGLLASGIALVYFAKNAIRSYVRGYVSETIAQVPLWIPESFMVMGLGIFLIKLVAYLLRVASGGADLSIGRAVDLSAD